MTTIGLHLICELSGCDVAQIGSVDAVREAMLRAAAVANVTVLNSYFHKFSPSGVSGLLCIAESHISVHTWPETGYAAVDVYTCGDRAMPHKAIQTLARAFGAKDKEMTEFSRGLPQSGSRFTHEVREAAVR